MIIRLALILSLLGCSAVSKTRKENQIQFGSVRYFGGVAKNEKWNDILEFQRVSWYQNLTLFYDVLAVELKTTSPFSKWLSEREVKEISQCSKFLVLMLYSTIPVKIAHSDFYTQVEAQGWKKIYIDDFGKSISTHPTHGDWRLQNYKVIGICHQSMNVGHIDLSFPSFNTIQMKF
jgi:hypothetical protein